MKKGFTLIEMLVTVGLFTIIITIAVGGFTNAIRTQRQVSSLISAQSNVSLVLEQMARQIRTGYLFCSTYGNTQAVAGGSPHSADTDCGCMLSLSPAPAGSWTCSGLDFYDAGSNHILYTAKNGALMASTTAGTQSITGNAVSVKYLNFQLYGQVEADHWTPRVTISIGIAPSSTDPAVSGDVINLETTVSARSIDCYTPSGSSTQC
jgi:prepilin-type N-terminal cleavage/methylation domain-containing protein